MLAERWRGHRLITQNLFISAVDFERKKQISMLSLQDLSILIDLFCLYDRVVVISRSSWAPFYKSGSELMDLLSNRYFVTISEPVREYEYREITITARKHLATFLGINDIERYDMEKYDEIFRYALSPSARFYSIQHYPADGMEAIRTGREWLSIAPTRHNLLRQLGREEKDVARGITFLVRTFLYLAYADVAKLTFTPDTIRAPILDNILKSENEFLLTALIKNLQIGWEHYPRSGYQELRRRVSPFAAIVFERARNRREIALQMENLRNELAPLREEIHKLEEKILWGSRDEAIDAERKWKQILKEIETNFGPDPHLVSIKRAIAFGKAIDGIIDEPTNWVNWLSSLTNLPLEVATRLVFQRPVIEIHRLRSQLPGPGRLAKSVERLFGTVL